MVLWRPHLYRQAGQSLGIDSSIIDHAVAAADAVVCVDPRLPPIFTLKHLSHLTQVEYGLLRNIVARRLDPYTSFRIRKRPSEPNDKRYRTICVPDPGLMLAQRWIAQRVLQFGRLHHASTAYAKGSSISQAAQPHCGSRWLVRIDIRNFFESVSEIAVYRVFARLGYQALPAFEMARLTTRLGVPTASRAGERWLARSHRGYRIGPYSQPRIGHLPQGAPTSPMLANLAAFELDQALTEFGRLQGLVYTRYADDLFFSSTDSTFGRKRVSAAIGLIYSLLRRFGFSPNNAKTRVSPPGARKIVLGLLVNGTSPRLTREFKSRLRQHLHFLRRPDIGPVLHAENRGFASVAGMRYHVEGLVAYARQIEPAFGDLCASQFGQIAWPL